MVTLPRRLTLGSGLLITTRVSVRVAPNAPQPAPGHGVVGRPARMSASAVKASSSDATRTSVSPDLAFATASGQLSAGVRKNVAPAARAEMSFWATPLIAPTLPAGSIV